MKITGLGLSFTPFTPSILHSLNPYSMRLKDLVVVTGFPGVQKMAANRNNGMLIEDLDSGKVRFAPVRKHQFSPMESISVFVDGDDDSVEIREVFQSMYDKLADTPLVKQDAKPDALRAYFATVLPNHDRGDPLPDERLGAWIVPERSVAVRVDVHEAR